VANVLLATGELDPQRLAVKGLADTQPRVPNDTPANRAKNRRVEIIVDRSDPMEEEVLRLREILGNPADKEGTTAIDVTNPDGPKLSW
jgi:chemotaxis protein MotB